MRIIDGRKIRSATSAKINDKHKNRDTWLKETKALKEKRGKSKQRMKVVRDRGGVIADRTFLRS